MPRRATCSVSTSAHRRTMTITVVTTPSSRTSRSGRRRCRIAVTAAARHAPITPFGPSAGKRYAGRSKDGADPESGGEASGPSPQHCSQAPARDRRLLVPGPGGATRIVARPGAAVDGGHLPRLTKPPLHHLVLAPGFRYGRDRSELEPDQLPVPGSGRRLPNDRHPDGRHSAGGHRDRHRPGDPDRLLRGSHRQPARAHLAAALDGAAALVKLPGAGLRVADDPLRRWRPQLDAAPIAPGLGQPRLLALEPVDCVLLPLAALRRAAGLCVAGAD